MKNNKMYTEKFETILFEKAIPLLTKWYYNKCNLVFRLLFLPIFLMVFILLTAFSITGLVIAGFLDAVTWCDKDEHL